MCVSIDMYSINCNKCKQYFRISYTHTRYLCCHGKEIPVPVSLNPCSSVLVNVYQDMYSNIYIYICVLSTCLFSVLVNIIDFENSGEDVTSEKYIQV